MIPQFAAQLAGTVYDAQFAYDAPDKYVLEEKFDGIRGLLVYDEESSPAVQMWNRHGQNKGRLDMNEKFGAEVLQLAIEDEGLLKGTVIDAEIVASTWGETMHLFGSASASVSGLRAVCFDLPFYRGIDLRDQAWDKRRALLEALINAYPQPHIVLSELLKPEPGLVEKIWAAGGEGIMIKTRDAQYASGGRGAWMKLKKKIYADAVILGFTGGRGKYSDTTGAVKLGMLKGGVMTEIAQVSGMTDEVRRSLGEDDIGTVIEFSAHMWAVNRYRHPQWERKRPDKEPADCVWEDQPH